MNGNVFSSSVVCPGAGDVATYLVNDLGKGHVPEFDFSYRMCPDILCSKVLIPAHHIYRSSSEMFISKREKKIPIVLSVVKNRHFSTGAGLAAFHFITDYR